MGGFSGELVSCSVQSGGGGAIYFVVGSAPYLGGGLERNMSLVFFLGEDTKQNLSRGGVGHWITIQARDGLEKISL